VNDAGDIASVDGVWDHGHGEASSGDGGGMVAGVRS
jgi:hypothetical protein